MVASDAVADKLERFAPTPWTPDSPEWQTLDHDLAADHLARRMAAAVVRLDLQPLFASYLGAGKPALRPDLLLSLVLYEMQNQRLSPAQWARDVHDSNPVRWLLFGMKPSRACLYAFRDRIAPLLSEWHAAVISQAVAANQTSATRAALDSSSVAAHASRRRLLNEAGLQQRRQTIDAALACQQRGEILAEIPAWLAKTVTGLRQQRQRYQFAAAVLQQRLLANAQRSSDKRKPPEKIRISPADPAAVLAHDKLNVFRPLYTIQLLRDLDSPLIFAHEVLAQNNDNGVLPPLLEEMMDRSGRKPEAVLVDAGYVSMAHLDFCALNGITLYGVPQENDYSRANGKKTQQNQHTEVPKSAFRWLPQEQTYECPEGHRLQFTKTQTQRRAEGRITLSIYTCPAEHCRACPRQSACTHTPERGRSVSRMENEELLEALRARMQTEEAKRLYKLRSQTVELNYADLKEHRGLRRFHGRGLERARAEVGLLVLAHNLLFMAAPGPAKGVPEPGAATAQTLCAA
jgi:hypothetical protein